MLSQVIKNNADIDIQDSNGWTVLHHSCYNGDYKSTQVLITNKANLYKRTNKKYLPIHLATINDHAQIIELLVESDVRKDNQLNVNT